MSTIDTTGAAGGSGSDAEVGKAESGSLGLGAAAALVMGSIIGTGVFLLPASLASFGTISLLAFVFTAIGAIALAQMFGVLSKRMPASRWWSLRLLPGGLRQRRRLLQRLVVLDHGLGRQRRDRGGLDRLRGGVHQHRPQQDHQHCDRAGGFVDPGGGQPLRGQEHGVGADHHHDHQVHPACDHLHRWALLHQLGLPDEHVEHLG